MPAKQKGLLFEQRSFSILRVSITKKLRRCKREQKGFSVKSSIEASFDQKVCSLTAAVSIVFVRLRVAVQRMQEDEFSVYHGRCAGTKPIYGLLKLPAQTCILAKKETSPHGTSLAAADYTDGTKTESKKKQEDPYEGSR